MATGSTFGWIASVGVHAVVGIAVALLERDVVKPPPTRITLVSTPKKVTPPKPPPAPVKAPKPVPAPEAPKPVAKAKPAPQPAAPAPAPAAPPPPRAAAAPPVDLGASFGVKLSGGTSAGGLAVPVGSPGGDPTQRTVREKVLDVAPASTTETACAEKPSRPKPLKTPQPAYPDAARAAEVEGKVRVELRLDESGRVAEARVLEGPGNGLDEAALEAVKTWEFEPSRACGVAVGTTFVLSVRFAL